MDARDDDSEPRHASDAGSSLSGLSSDFEDSVLRRVAECTDPEASDPGAPAIGSVLDGKYRLEGLLGRGGMGFVFAARHLTTGRPVAIKWMLRRGDLAQQKERFVREARAAGRIRHPNVIDIYDVVSDEHATYLVIELLEGESLRARLGRERLEPAEAVQIAVSVLEGLTEAHRQGVIHRDLKPENVFLRASPPGTKILDFGISVLTEARPATDSNLTKTGYFVGTPIYTPLERLREKQPFDHRVDLYSVGVMLYEMLTGSLPYSGRTPSELAYQLAVSAPRPPRERRPDLAPELEAVLLKALARQPDERFRDADQFIEALGHAMKPPRSAGALFRRVRAHAGAAMQRRPVRAAAALFFVLAVGLALGMLSPTEPARVMQQGVVVPVPSLVRRAASAPVSNSEPALAVSAVLPTARPEREQQKRAGPAKRPDSAARASAVPSPAATAAAAEVSVVVFPYGDVWVDGRRVGSSPANLKLPAGVHRIGGGRISPEKELTVDLKPDESRHVTLSWTKAGSADAGRDPGPPNAAERD